MEQAVNNPALFPTPVMTQQHSLEDEPSNMVFTGNDDTDEEALDPELVQASWQIPLLHATSSYYDSWNSMSLKEDPTETGEEFLRNEVSVSFRPWIGGFDCSRKARCKNCDRR